MIDTANCGCPDSVKKFNSYSLFPYSNPGYTERRVNNLTSTVAGIIGYSAPVAGCSKPSGGSPDQWYNYAKCLQPFHDTMNCYEIQGIIDFCQGWIDQELRDNASGVSRSTRAGNNDIITGFTMYQTEMKAKKTAAQCDNQILVDQNAIQTAASLNAAQGAQNISQAGQKPVLWVVYAVLAIIAIVIAVKVFKKKK